LPDARSCRTRQIEGLKGAALFGIAQALLVTYGLRRSGLHGGAQASLWRVFGAAGRVPGFVKSSKLLSFLGFVSAINLAAHDSRGPNRH